MAFNANHSAFGIAAANPAELNYATDRLMQEHELLREQLKTLEIAAKNIKQLQDLSKGVSVLRMLTEQTSAFVASLDSHAKWEDEELFPFLQAYQHRMTAPSIAPSFWVLEKDHQLAMLFIESFQEAAAQAVKPAAAALVKQRMEEAAGNLIQACLILSDHLTMEEQLVFPLTEQVLTDLEYFFS